MLAQAPAASGGDHRAEVVAVEREPEPRPGWVLRLELWFEGLRVECVRLELRVLDLCEGRVAHHVRVELLTFAQILCVPPGSWQ